MIQNIENNGRQIRVRASERLRVHFLALARRLADWRRARESSGCLALGVAPIESRVGSSTVAFNLAASLATISTGNVLLIECAFGKPNISRRTPRPGKGLAEVLQGTETPPNCIFPTSIEQLYFMGTGLVDLADAMQLPFEAIRTLNAEIGDSFDYVIYDLPTANEVTACYPIVQQLDASIIVAEANVIDEDRINRVSKRYEELQTPLIGMVLNKS